MQYFTVRQYLEHYQTDYNTKRIRAGLIALLPSTADGTHEFESMHTVFTAYADELTDPLLMTARTYLGEYHQQYDSSRVLNDLVAMLPPNGTGLYTLELLRTTFSDYVESIPSLEDYTLPTAPNGSRTMINPAVIERWKARREAP